MNRLKPVNQGQQTKQAVRIAKHARVEAHGLAQVLKGAVWQNIEQDPLQSPHRRRGYEAGGCPARAGPEYSGLHE